MAKGILLEAGTNEMELLIFRLNDVAFGVNVAKVREIIQRVKTISIPYSPPAVEGSFKLRNQVLTLVNLGRYFDMQGKQTNDGEGLIIIVEFNNIHCGILVDKVDVIQRLHWNDIQPPSEYLMNLQAPVTGTCQVNDDTILIADFETIISDILGLESATIPVETGSEPVVERKDLSLFVADDSTILRKTLVKVLNGAGFQNLCVYSDGQEMWDALEEAREQKRLPDLILTDIEMPRMDGLHLTSRVKHDPDMQHIPVILFSSLITDDNRRKGESVGADAQVSKPNSQEMIEAVERCLGNKLAKEEAVTA